MSENGHCPNCKVDLDAGSIWKTFFEKYGDESKADETAALYGATREKGQWGRQIGMYDMNTDRIMNWKCPDCDHIWERV